MFTAIDHVGVAVADLDAAVRFYQDTFGMEKVHEEVNEDQGVREAMMRVGQTDSYVQLLAPLRADSPIGKFLESSGPGLQQVAYRVTDIRATAQSLRDRGVRVLYDEPRRGTDNALINFVHPKDVGGVLIELVQPAQ